MDGATTSWKTATRRAAVYGGAFAAPACSIAAAGAPASRTLPVAFLLGLFLAATLEYFAAARPLLARAAPGARCSKFAVSAAVAGVVLAVAPAAGAHDLHLKFDVKSISARTSGGTVSGDITGALTAKRQTRALSGARWRVAATWRVRAGERSFAARLRGVVNTRTRRAVLAGSVTSGFAAGAELHATGRLRNRKPGRLTGTLTLVPHAARRAAAGSQAGAGGACADPCAFVAVVRYGEGRVTNTIGGSPGDIDCGTRCSSLVSSPTSPNLVLHATGGSFAGWTDCPASDGNRCVLPLDGKSHCVHAYFTPDRDSPPTAGACPSGAPAPPPPPVPADRRAPDTRITAAPPARTRARRAVFAFRADEHGSRFRCRLDARAWKACTSPQTYRRLAPGAHVFRVAAVDAAGNRDTTPAVRRWKVRSR